MLLHLSIRNFAIIDAQELQLGPGFTVVTGETGAGKSILVDALSLVLGGRANSDLVRTGAEAAEVEALFDITAQPKVKERLAARELAGDDPNVLLVRREVGRQGRGKVVVNGRLSTVATLGEIVRGLVEISGQHEQVSLLQEDAHLDLLDDFAGLAPRRAAFRQLFSQRQEKASRLQRLREGGEAALRQADYLRFTLEEIERLAPEPGEDESLEAERLRLAHAEKLRHGTQFAEALLYGDDGSAFDKLGKAMSELENLGRIDADLLPVNELLTSARRDLQEAARSLQRYGGRLEADPSRLDQVESRLADLRRLCRKHGGSVPELLRRAAEMRLELEAISGSDEELVRLGAELVSLDAELSVLAQALSAERHKAKKRFEKAVAEELTVMDMAGARLVVELAARPAEAQAPAFGPAGADLCRFLWSPNRGEAEKALARIASGGELSRLMLAVRSLLATPELVALYVFDEVDTGLGGAAAEAIGRRIRQVAQGQQAICITHLAPIAARADRHLRVKKREDGGRTLSRLELLDGDERLAELARMIGGSESSRAARGAAEEMVALAQSETSGKAAGKSEGKGRRKSAA